MCELNSYYDHRKLRRNVVYQRQVRPQLMSKMVESMKLLYNRVHNF